MPILSSPPNHRNGGAGSNPSLALTGPKPHPSQRFIRIPANL
jgi:hypothetical protein